MNGKVKQTSWQACEKSSPPARVFTSAGVDCLPCTVATCVWYIHGCQARVISTIIDPSYWANMSPRRLMREVYTLDVYIYLSFVYLRLNGVHSLHTNTAIRKCTVYSVIWTKSCAPFVWFGLSCSPEICCYDESNLSGANVSANVWSVDV